MEVEESIEAGCSGGRKPNKDTTQEVKQIPKPGWLYKSC